MKQLPSSVNFLPSFLLSIYYPLILFSEGEVKCMDSSSEQLKGSAERTEEEPQPPVHPPVVVDHQRLLVK